MKALVVDDSVFMRKALNKIINDYVESVFEAGDFESAVSAFKQENPDIVFLDIMMEKTDTGLTILDTIKQINPNSKIVVVSSLDKNSSIAKEAFEKGISGFVRKPFSPESIQEFLK
ncbi:MAG: response regulator [Nanobdellota archaeon]